MKLNFFILFITLNAIVVTCLNQFVEDEFCTKEVKCISKQKIPMRIKNKDCKLFKFTKCKCNGKFKYNCGESYCAKSKNGCNENNLKFLKSNESMVLRIKNCDILNVNLKMILAQ